MDFIIEGILEFIFEFIIEFIIPTVAGAKREGKRGGRLARLLAFLLVYLVVIVIGALMIWSNQHKSKWIIYGIFLIVGAGMFALVAFLRAKAFKMSFVYSLNFIVVLAVSIMSSTEIIILARDNPKHYKGFIGVGIVALLSVIYTIIRLRRALATDRKIAEMIKNGEYETTEILNMANVKVATTDGIRAYYNLVGGDIRKVENLRGEIPGILYFALINNFKRIASGEEVIRADDEFIKIFSSNIDRYVYIMLYDRIG